jgi:hypothetical protein
LVCSWLVFAAEDEQTKWPTDLYPQIWSKRSLTVIPLAIAPSNSSSKKEKASATTITNSRKRSNDTKSRSNGDKRRRMDDDIDHNNNGNSNNDDNNNDQSNVLAHWSSVWSSRLRAHALIPSGRDSSMFRLLSARMSYPLTIVHALRGHLPMVMTKFQSHARLVLHIIGASGNECSDVAIWNELAYYLLTPTASSSSKSPSSSSSSTTSSSSSSDVRQPSIAVVLVGPEVPTNLHGTCIAHTTSGNNDATTTEVKTSSPSVSTSFTLTVHFVRALYHDLVTTVADGKDASSSTTVSSSSSSSSSSTSSSSNDNETLSSSATGTATATSGTTTSTTVMDGAWSSVPLIADVIVGFNMGLTCPDYRWQQSLSAMTTPNNIPPPSSKGREVKSTSPTSSSSATAASSLSSMVGPYLIATSGTNMELKQDVKRLSDAFGCKVD